jgi:hypothetical protein
MTWTLNRSHFWVLTSRFVFTFGAEFGQFGVREFGQFGVRA